MSITAWIAVLVIIATIYCLIKRYETRLVLFTAGLFLLHLYETDGSFRPVCQEHDERQLDHGNLRCDGLCLRRYAHFLRSSSG